MQIAEKKGIIDRIYVEKQSQYGNVWLRFRGLHDEAVKSAKSLVETLNDKTFDDRKVQAKFIPDSLFYSKVK